MPHVWLHVPPERAVYSNLSTDHYPWTEVYTDLAQRPQFSGVLDVKQGALKGRLVWVEGELRGAHDLQEDLEPRLLCATCARGTVTLSALEPALAALIWLCRDGERAALPLQWPDARDLLASRRFRGALLSTGTCSYWEDGRILAGTLPAAGEQLHTVSPRARYTHADLEVFWSEVLRAAASRFPLSETWRTAATTLADAHPCLDPFAREVWLEGVVLQIDPELPIPELRAALLAQYRAMLSVHGLTPRQLPMPEARAHPLWPSSGLEE